MASVLITGSSRGIGFYLVKEFLKASPPPAVLIATCRNPDKATELQGLASKHSNLHILKLDVCNTDSFAKVVQQVDGIVGDKGLNLLINNAGIALGDKMANFEDVTVTDYRSILDTNLVGPFFLVQALLPLVRRAAALHKDSPMSIQRAAIVNISSFLGSVSLNANEPGSSGNYWVYRESKSALNQFSRSLCRTLEPEGIIVAPLHPGWVRTDLGGPNALVEPDDSSKGLMNVILNLSKENNGKFITWEGNELAW